ncbi:S-layer homology domain-containing protein [Paenibacillus mendelii]|uniref:S-layer homology domain-containing protein n=1 Tax=Paenibacillus mendelii TaxID=206163 RepID=A0ABV6JL87_9BACL|nr:S-layer homology domain-containing protein [Paenibacillus mendelii]MCQ6562307.1 DUF4038 domain-containing protein [Paenibacillus mendelii]
MIAKKRRLAGWTAIMMVFSLLLQLIPAGIASAESALVYSEPPETAYLISKGSEVIGLSGMEFNDGDPVSLTDGNPATMAGGKETVDFYLDLGSRQPLNYVRILFNRMWDGINELYVSDDGVNWGEPILTSDGADHEYMKDTAATDGEKQPNELGALLPAGTEGRYVRLTAKGWANMYEVEIYSPQEPLVVDTNYSEPPVGSRIVSQGAAVAGYNGMKFNDGDPVHITDGSPATMAGGYGKVDFYVDLGRELALDYVNVLFNRFWNGTNKIYVSSDAVNWTRVISSDGSAHEYLKDRAATDGEKQPNELGALLPAGTKGRYVRFTARDWANLYEFRVYASQSISVEHIAVQGPAKLEVVNGLSMKLTAAVGPASATDRSVTWSAAPKDGSTGDASIDAQTGLLTAKSPGIVTVTATAADGSGITGSADVVILPEAQTWRELELALESDAAYDNPFLDVDVTAAFTGPSGEVLTRPAFWDGGGTWKVRFAPTMAGEWTVTTASNQPGDTGLNLSEPIAFTAVSYDGPLEIYKRGFLNAEEGKRYLMYGDGTPFFYLGDTHWLMPDEDFESSNVDGIDSQFRYAVDHRASQGYTVYQSEPLYSNGMGLNVSKGITSDSLAKLADIDRKFQYVADAGLVHANAALTFTSVLNVTDPDLLQRLGRYWQARYGAYPVLWTTAQEIDPLMGGVDPQYWQLVAKGIHDSDAYKHPLTAHMAAVASFETTWGDKPYHSWFAAQVLTLTKEFYQSFMAYPAVKPIVTYETGYEHNSTTTEYARKAPYIAFQNGSFGFGYGAQGVWAINHSPDDWFHYGPYYRWFDGLNAQAGSQMTYFKQFYSDLEWWKLTPVFGDTSYADFAAHSQSFLAVDGSRTYAAYFADTTKKRTGTLKRMADTTYKAQWFNTRTGEYTLISDQVIPEGGQWTVPEKPDEEDWMLLVTSAESALAPKLIVSSSDNATTIFTQHGTLQMSASIAGEDRTGEMDWSVTGLDGSGTLLASIDAGGLLTASGNGIVRVIAAAKDGSGMTSSKTVIITRQDRSEPPAKATKITVKDGGNRQMLAYFEPAYSLDQRVEWAVYEADGVTPTDKAQISEVGVVYLLEEGTVKVVATAMDGSGTSGSYDYTIKFNDKIVNPLFEGATVTASTTDYRNDYRPIKAITSNHGDWAGWTSGLNNATSYDNPQWLQVAFKESTTFNHVEVYSTKGFQMKDFDVQYWDGTQWIALYSVTGNESEAVKALIPDVTTEKIRVISYKGDALGISRVSAIEVYQDEQSHDARLKGITVGGSPLQGFEPGKTGYDVKLPAGTAVVPSVMATAMDTKASVTIVQSGSTSGKATIEVTAEDGVTKTTYEVRLSVEPGGYWPGTITGPGSSTEPGTKPDTGTDPVEEPGTDEEPQPGGAGTGVKLTDVPSSHWAAESIRQAAQLGIVTGYEDGTFKPGKEVSRAEFVAMLARALKWPASDAANLTSFTDAGSIAKWARLYIAQAVEKNLITGYADRTFRPDSTMTRTEMAALMARAAGLQVTAAGSTQPELSFADAGRIPQWAIPYVAAAADAGLIKGVGNNRFDPDGIVTRAQAVTIIMAMLNTGKANGGK